MNTPETESRSASRVIPVLIAVAGACLVFAALVWATKKYTQPAPLGADRVAERTKARAELTAAETDALNNAGWIDQPKGLVRLPIAEAMKLAEREWQNPAQARSNLLARVEKANALPPKAPEKPSPFE